MRRAHFMVMALGLLGGSATVGAAGCGSFTEACLNNLDGVCPSFVEGSGGGGNPPTAFACDGDPTLAPEKILDECAVFVHANATTGGDGTQTAPFASLQEAIDRAEESGHNKWIIACADGEFTEALTIASPRRLYGGFDCVTDPSKWSPTASAKTRISAPASAIAKDSDDLIALRLLAGADTTILHAFAITAADAALPGGSSIALLATDATAIEIQESELNAGKGASGDDGTLLSDDPDLNGISGKNGSDLCNGGLINPGAPPVTKDCSSSGGLASVGGKGGDGGAVRGMTEAPAEDGFPGAPKGKANGGHGQGQSGSPNCSDGMDGEDGLAGTPGEGAKGLGSLSPTGMDGASAKDGAPGNPGQGGGGGGGAEGKFKINCGSGSATYVGASGGSGGSGGCGGRGGHAGKTGGSSIALASLSSTIRLSGVLLQATMAGDGGDGRPGQSGGLPGQGGAGASAPGGAKNSCAGGKGGAGGAGGQGGGGAGGHSLGIAYVGNVPMLSPDTLIQRAPQGGAGGLGKDAAGKGDDGKAADMLALE